MKFAVTLMDVLCYCLPPHGRTRGTAYRDFSRLLGHAKLSTEGYIAAASLEKLKQAYARARNADKKAGTPFR
jgi:hypothetical protein